MKDIAAELGVSVATVSRALQNSASISQDKRDKIRQYAMEHNYLPNVLATELRNSKRSPAKVIGVIVPEFVHYYFASILSGIEAEASRQGYRMIVAQSGERYEREVEICESFYQNKVCGVIVSQAKDTVDYSHFTRLIGCGVPLVFYDRICAGINCSRVVADDYQAAYGAVKHLIDRGCRRVAFYAPSFHLEISQNRFNGYKDAMAHSGLDVDEAWVHECDNRADAERITQSLMAQDHKPDGFLATTDDIAIGILYTVKHMGYQVPRDVQICGFSNSFWSQASEPMLTSVEQHGTKVGREAVEVLIDMVTGVYPISHVEKRIVKTSLVVRGTTR